MKYTALTIGPIVKSLALAHKTRELWAASYFYSFLMEEIIKEISIKNKDSIIIPYADKVELIKSEKIDSEKVKIAGIFPDRLILQSESGLFNALQEAVNKALETVFDKFSVGDNCKEELLKYLRTHIIEDEYDEDRLSSDTTKKDNVIYQFSDYLAGCELQNTFVGKDNNCFLKIMEGINTSKLYKDKFKSDKYPFPSIIEIATNGLKLPDNIFNDWEKDDSDYWDEIIEIGKREKQQVKNKKLDVDSCNVYSKLKTVHKYIAIVQADGDNIGELIKNIYSENENKIKEFSKALSSFSLKATEIIHEYGGVPVYAGGDDLLFFAPIEGKEKNLFEMIGDIDKVFNEYINENELLKSAIPGKTPSMSYGVSISYYKYPMHEALKTAGSLLFEKAKDGAKNAIAYKVLKHSRHVFEAVLQKPIDKEFTSIFNGEGVVLNSLIYNLERHKTILRSVIGDIKRLQPFFDNIYNDKIHDTERSFVNMVCELLYSTHENFRDRAIKEKEDKKVDKNVQEEEVFDNTMSSVYAKLRLVKFLNSKNDE